MVNSHIHVPYNRLYDYIDIITKERFNLEIYFNSQSLDQITKKDIEKLKNVFFDELSLSFHAPFMDLSPGALDSKVREVTIERFNQVFDIATILTPKSIVFHSGYEKWKYAFKVNTWLEASLKTWEKILPRAEQLKTKIAIENIFEEDPESLRMLVEKFSSSYFGICFDTGHFNIFSKKSLEEWICCLNDYIFEIHLHDNNKNFDEHLAIGAGCFDFKKFFELFKNKNCIYTIEAHTPENVFKSIRMLEQLIK
ncbi:MAG: sugar phosphate isomerase/epimerase family protein [Thermodesulfovibrio sp.]|nr:sugar phosphate isomerase/epimerase [Thermodesulfovibrio sp.]MDW7997975.1 sugar phosphate isomerase/epimerase family protein [Thermodesulfovibrio sp.]